MSPPNSPHPPLARVIRLLSIALLVLAIGFRFIHLDRKVYWHDEAFTSMVITARPGNYLSKELFQNKVVQPADLLAYQQFVPTLTLQDMVVRKGLEDAQHPPLYYLFLRFWAMVWGTSPAAIRSFSALLSLLLFPAVYWLCWELFESALAGWVAIALFAVSPFHLVYAQEAREFGVWSALSLVSSALLLRALRTSSWRNWFWYGLSMAIAFYTALFTLWIAVGHGFYTLVMDDGTQLFKWPLRVGNRTARYIVTLLMVMVLFSPWVYVMLTSGDLLGKTTSWTAVPLPWTISLQTTIFNFSRSFVDFNLALNDPTAYVLALPVLGVQGYAVYVLCRTAPKRIGWFLLTFVGSTGLALGVPDLLSGGQRFTVSRYLFPCFIGLQLAVVYLLAINFTKRHNWQVRFATLVLSLLVLLGVLSCSVYAQSNTWWNKVLNSNYHQVAALINESDRPLIITDAYSYNPASMISLSYLLKPTVHFLLLPAVGNSFPMTTMPKGFGDIFLVNLPPVFRQQFEANYHQQPVSIFEDPWNSVWEVTRSQSGQ
jgi:uncharacterized membrane protein